FIDDKWIVYNQRYCNFVTELELKCMTTQLHQATQKWAFLLFTIGVFMAGLDNGIISTAMTTINESFKVPPSWGAWSITLYTLGIAISAPIIGKLADRFGRRRLFVIEIAL